MDNNFKPPSPLFDGGNNPQDNWKLWKQKFQIYLTATNKLSASKEIKIATLLSCIGDEGIDIYNSFTEDQQSTLEKLIKAFDDYFLPKKVIPMESFKFYTMVQGENQTIDQFLTELKKQAKLCDFFCVKDGCNESFEERMIRDRLIVGISCRESQLRLLREPDLTIKKIIDYCKSIELSKIHVKMLNKEEEVNYVKSVKIKCRKCLYEHYTGKCPASDKQCNICKRTGHFSKACFFKKTDQCEKSPSTSSRNIDSREKMDHNKKIWPKIQNTLQQQEAIGSHLTLRCVIHKHRVTRVTTAGDFANLPLGGCDLVCETPLNCGHVCLRSCHIEDREHAKYKCRKTCGKILCDDQSHVCDKLCYETCDPCSYPVERHLKCGHVVKIACHLDPTTYNCRIAVEATLPCGHVQYIACHMDPITTYNCPIPVEATLPCDHITMKPCYMDKKTVECPFPCDNRVEPCGHSCEKKCHVMIDPDHLDYSCRKPCDNIYKGCTADEPHICQEYCSKDCGNCPVLVCKTRSCGHIFEMECSINPEDIVCEEPCKKLLNCGHKCEETCSDPCGLCKEKVETILPDCNHTIKLKCFETPSRAFCKKKCPFTLPCGHACDKKCNEVCTEECKEIVDCSITSPCGHIIKNIIKKIPCHFKKNPDDNIFAQNCTEPCNAQLICTHKCSGSCVECYQGRFHQRCQENCNGILVCNHECPIPCSEYCQPCRKPCEYSCVHGKCKKKCGDPCAYCRKKCPRWCPHQSCENRCGDLCSVEPCTEQCPKSINKCGHPCVGFCGDPCPPLCRICDVKELTEIFFGTEGNVDARFVLLLDCGHVMESTGMTNWLNQKRGNNDEDQKIQPLGCPKCKTVIKKSARYSDYVKKHMIDLRNVKLNFYGKLREIEFIKHSLKEKLSKMYYGNGKKEFVRNTLRFNTRNRTNNRNANHAFVTLKANLANRLRYSWDIDKMDLEVFRMKIELMQAIMEPLEKEELSLFELPLSNNHVSLLVRILEKNIDYITEQEVIDIDLELNRLHRLIQFERLGYKSYLHQPSVQTKVDAIINMLNKYGRYDDDQDRIIKKLLEELKVLTFSRIDLTDAEKRKMVKTVELRRGHWYKCPNGHPYTIKECGRATEKSRCYECGAPISGRNHALAPDNAVVTEIAGARDGALSDQAKSQVLS